MRPEQSKLTRATADILTGYYRRKRLTQEDLATRTEIPLTSLQRKLKGTSPITATDLVLIATAIGVDPAVVLTEATEEAGIPDLSDPPASEDPVSLEEHRARRKPSEMTDDEMEGVRNAAGTDSELDEDEPALP